MTKISKFKKNVLRRSMTLLGIAAATLSGANADPALPHGIVAASIGVQQLGFANGPENVIVTNQYAIGDFIIRASANKGDYDVQIGELLSDDVDGGVLITSIAENGGRDNVDEFGSPDPIYPGVNTATSHIDYSRSGANAAGYFIPVAMTLPNATATTVVEYNLNVNAGWFPYDRWLGGFVRNSGGTNGGANNLLTGSSSLVLGTHFKDLGAGRSTIDLTTLGINSQTDGVLLVVGAKNEDNYALSQANADGTWSIFSKDNGTDSTSLEQDPIAFVYIPKTNALVVSGRFNADGSASVAGGNFTVTPVDIGQWELKIPGRSPANGVLITSPEGGMPQNRDNIISAAPNAARDGWIIESRDLPNSVPPGETMPVLETPEGEPVASFVFIPGATAGFTVSPTNNVFTTESGGVGTFTVTLDTAPTADVTFTISSANAAEGIVSPSTLTFTPVDWNVPQTVTVTGQDDAAADGAITYAITMAAATSADASYNGRDPVNVTVINLDNDGAFTINPTAGLATTEAGGTATFTVRLDARPTSSVTIGLSSSDSSEVTLAPNSLIFTPDNWQQEQSITISGQDDSVDDGDAPFTIVTAPAVSEDPFYNGKDGPDVAGINGDNDAVGITVSPTSGLEPIEGGAVAAYTIVLASEPTANVVITGQSGNATQLTVSPETVTFTPANWSAPQTVTLTAVNDLADDGNIALTVTNTVSSADPLYAPLAGANVTATALDNEAALTLSTEPVFYGIGMPAIGVAGRASLIDTNTANYNSATLRIALTAGAEPTDRLEIRGGAGGEGEISVAGSNISYESIVIGSFAGGTGSTPLTISFTANATPTAAEALLRAITFRSVAESPSRTPRSLEITLTDADGGVTTGAASIRTGLLRRTEFQEGADHGYGIYTGAADTELYELQPDTPKPTGRGGSGLFIDWRDADNPNAGQVLLRFDNLVGDGPGQIPTNAIIVSAELFLDINDSGDASPLHRMLVPWDAENDTWNTLGGGITPDDIRARAEFDSQIGLVDGSGATTIGTVWVSVTPDVQAWVSGRATNYGWVMPAWELRLDGTGFSSSEAAAVGDRPSLRVSWLPPGSASLASFRQAENEYAGAIDTRIRQNAPDADFSTVGTMFVDAQVSAGEPNPEQILLRFDELFGNGPGQIPPGSRIEAAMIDLASVNGDAMGDGGLFYRLRQPWPELVTWAGWVDGVQTNGVEAATVPSAIAGNETRNPDVQAGFLSFDLTADVQAWSNGQQNNGWVITPWEGGGNGWGFTTSENETERNRPRLRVFYTQGQTVDTIRIHMPVWNNGALQLSFQAAAGGAYDVMRAETLNGGWTKVGTAATDQAGMGSYTDSAAPAKSAFYRIVRP